MNENTKADREIKQTEVEFAEYQLEEVQQELQVASNIVKALIVLGPTEEYCKAHKEWEAKHRNVTVYERKLNKAKDLVAHERQVRDAAQAASPEYAMKMGADRDTIMGEAGRDAGVRCCWDRCRAAEEAFTEISLDTAATEAEESSTDKALAWHREERASASKTLHDAAQALARARKCLARKEGETPEPKATQPDCECGRCGAPIDDDDEEDDRCHNCGAGLVARTPASLSNNENHEEPIREDDATATQWEAACEQWRSVAKAYSAHWNAKFRPDDVPADQTPSEWEDWKRADRELQRTTRVAFREATVALASSLRRIVLSSQKI